MKTLTVFLIACCLVKTGTAQTIEYLKNNDDIKKYSGSVVEKLIQSDVPTAFGLLKTHWPASEGEMDQAEHLTFKQFNVADERYGKILGSEFLKEEKIRDFALRETYVIRFEKHLINIYFVYYKNDKGWLLSAFKCNDKINELF